MTAVRSSFYLTLGSGEYLTAAAALARVGASLTWEVRPCGPGSKGERLYSWATIGNAAGGTLLMRRRTPDKRHEKIDFFYCKPPAGQVCAPRLSCG